MKKIIIVLILSFINLKCDFNLPDFEINPNFNLNGSGVGVCFKVLEKTSNVPIESALVTFSTSTNFAGSKKTNSNGTVCFNQTNCLFKYWVSKDGFVTNAGSVTIKGTKISKTIYLEPDS